MSTDFPANTNWHLLPAGIRPAIERYVRHGTRPLSRFLIAALENDLDRVARHGGELRGLLDAHDMLRFMRFYMPENSWGSRHKVAEWEYSGGLEGMRRIQREPFESLAREFGLTSQ